MSCKVASLRPRQGVTLSASTGVFSLSVQEAGEGLRVPVKGLRAGLRVQVKALGVTGGVQVGGLRLFACRLQTALRITLEGLSKDIVDNHGV